MVSLKDLQKEAYEIADSKGWHETPTTFGDDLALIHSEVSEALEAFRDNDNQAFNAMEPLYESVTSGKLTRARTEFVLVAGEGEREILNKPAGVPSELADIMIRVAHVAEKRGVDLEKAVREKMAFNRTRSYRHGKKAL